MGESSVLIRPGLSVAVYPLRRLNEARAPSVGQFAADTAASYAIQNACTRTIRGGTPTFDTLLGPCVAFVIVLGSKCQGASDVDLTLTLTLTFTARGPYLCTYSYWCGTRAALYQYVPRARRSNSERLLNRILDGNRSRRTYAARNAIRISLLFYTTRPLR